jgi:hypothetical protein
MSEFSDILGAVDGMIGAIQNANERRIDMARRYASVKIDQMNTDFLTRAADPAANGITTENWKVELEKHNDKVNEFIDSCLVPGAAEYIKADFAAQQGDIALGLAKSMYSQAHDQAFSQAILTRQAILNSNYDPDTRKAKLDDLSSDFDKTGMFAPKTIAEWRMQDESDFNIARATRDTLAAAGGDFEKAQDLIMSDENLSLSTAERVDIARKYQTTYAVKSQQYLQNLGKRLDDPEHRWTRDETLQTIRDVEDSSLSSTDKEKAKGAVYKEGYLDFFNSWVGAIGLAKMDLGQLQNLRKQIDVEDPYWNSPTGEPDRDRLRDSIDQSMAALTKGPGKLTDEEIKAMVYQQMMKGVLYGVGDKEFQTTIVAPLILDGDPRFSYWAAQGMKELPTWRETLKGGSGTYLQGLQRVMDWGKGRKDGKGALVESLFKSYFKAHPGEPDYNKAADVLMAGQSASTLADWTDIWDQGKLDVFGGRENYFAASSDKNAKPKYEAAVAKSKKTFMETFGFTDADEKAGKFVASVRNDEPVYITRDARGNETIYDPQNKGGRLGFQARGAKGGGTWTAAKEPGTAAKAKAKAAAKVEQASAEEYAQKIITESDPKKRKLLIDEFLATKPNTSSLGDFRLRIAGAGINLRTGE